MRPAVARLCAATNGWPSRGGAGRRGRGLAAGKLPPRLLDRLLRWRGAADRRVLIGPGCGVDAAVVAIGRRRLILKADPVTFTARRVGWHVVQVNANDVAVMGARPAWFQPTILLPPGTRAAVVMAIAREIDHACRALGVAVTGGHTEVTDAVTRPVVAGDCKACSSPAVSSRPAARVPAIGCFRRTRRSGRCWTRCAGSRSHGSTATGRSSGSWSRSCCPT